MPILKYAGKAVFYIHIPKTGGTSIYKNLEKQSVNIEEYRANHIAPQHKHIDLLRLENPEYTKLNPFTIMRDPWDRTCSEFLWRFKMNSLSGLNDWVANSLEDLKYNRACFSNHIRPQMDFIDSNVKVFSLLDYDLALKHINRCLNHKFIYDRVYNASIKIDYSNPSQHLSLKTRGLWNKTYEEDLLFYKNLG